MDCIPSACHNLIPGDTLLATTNAPTMSAQRETKVSYSSPAVGEGRNMSESSCLAEIANVAVMSVSVCSSLNSKLTVVRSIIVHLNHFQ